MRSAVLILLLLSGPTLTGCLGASDDAPLFEHDGGKVTSEGGYARGKTDREMRKTLVEVDP